MADESNDRPQDEAGNGDPLGRAPAAGSGWLDKIIGQEGDRKARLIGLGGVVVVLLILGLYATINHRATERRNLGVIGEVAKQNTPVARLGVIKQEVVDGVVMTHLRWSELDPSGAEGNAQEIQLPGDQLHVDVNQATLTHRKLEEPVDLVYFASLSSGEAEPYAVIEPRGPFYYHYQGERDSSVARTAKHLWAILGDERPAPAYLQVEKRALGGLDLPLLIGEQWELSLGPTGVVELRRARSPRDEYERFDPSAAVVATNQLSVALEEVIRQVEYADQLDPERVYYRLAIRLDNGSSESLTVDPNLFQIQDDNGRVILPRLISRVQLAPGRGQTVRLAFETPPQATGLRFTVPGLTVAGGDGTQPLVIFLQREGAYLGDARPSGDFLASLDYVERKVVDGDFVVVATFSVANLTEDSETLKPKQFTLEALQYDKSESIEATEVSVAEIEPYFPEQVAVTFPVGPVLERADLQARFTGDRKNKVHPDVVFNLVPLPEADADAGRHFLQQVCGAQHYTAYHELMFEGPGGVLGLLSDKKAREKEAQRHLDLAGRFYPDSKVIATAAP